MTQEVLSNETELAEQITVDPFPMSDEAKAKFKGEMDLILKNSREMSDEEFKKTLFTMSRNVGKPSLANQVANMMIQERINHLSKSMTGVEAANKVKASLHTRAPVRTPPLQSLFPGLGAKKGKK